MKLLSVRTIMVGWLFLYSISVQGQSPDRLHPWSDFIESEYKETLITGKAHFVGKYHFLATIKNKELYRLREADIDIERRLDTEHYIVRATREVLSQYRNYFKQVWYANDLWKLAPGMTSSRSQEGATVFTLHVIDAQSVKLKIEQLPAIELLQIDDTWAEVRCSYVAMEKYLLGIKEVDYIGIENTEPHPESIVFDMNLVPNGIRKLHHSFPDLKGQGMTLSIKEQQYKIDDIDLQGRHIASGLAAFESSAHATDMATLAAGAGNSSMNSRGVVSESRLTSSDFDSVLPDSDQDYLDLNAFVQNHSYGTAVENFYGLRAKAFDESANNNFMLLHVFSSGNRGNATPSEGIYQGLSGFANLTGNSKMAKNIITVGSVDLGENSVFSSSKGPTYDGRVKPELTTYSTVGSSNSAALVSGTAIALQQAYKEKNAGEYPAAALVKALLINSARDVGPPGIDFLTGYGSIDAVRSIGNIDRFFEGSISQGESATFKLDIPGNATDLKVTMVWNDPAAAANSNIALVNDLDLTITDPSGAVLLPWVLDSTPSVEKLMAPAVRKEDHLNVVEQITLKNPTKGTYLLKINSEVLPIGPQPFYIAYQWREQNRFEWTYPTGSDNLPFDGELTEDILYWDSTFPEGTMGDLEYSTDDGKIWKRIASGIDLAVAAHAWNIPDVITKAQLRMTVGPDSYDSDTFVISRSPRVIVGLSCADSILVQWSRLEGIKEYMLFNYMEDGTRTTALTTSDTLAVIRTTDYDSRFFSVQPVTDSGLSTARSPTFDYESLSFGCYEIFFSGKATVGGGISLEARLSTVFAIEKVIFERSANKGSFQAIATIGSDDANELMEYIDEMPSSGNNTYRVRLVLNNDQEIFSEELTIYSLRELNVIIYPNPVESGQLLNIDFKNEDNEEAEFTLYDSQGKALIVSNLDLGRKVIELPPLGAGIFLFRVTLGSRNYVGKVMID